MKAMRLEGIPAESWECGRHTASCSDRRRRLRSGQLSLGPGGSARVLPSSARSSRPSAHARPSGRSPPPGRWRPVLVAGLVGCTGCTGCG